MYFPNFVFIFFWGTNKKHRTSSKIQSIPQIAMRFGLSVCCFGIFPYSFPHFFFLLINQFLVFVSLSAFCSWFLLWKSFFLFIDKEKKKDFLFLSRFGQMFFFFFSLSLSNIGNVYSVRTNKKFHGYIFLYQNKYSRRK